MTNRELIAAISAKTALSQQTSREVLQTVIETIQDAVWDGDRVTVTDFGTFFLTESKPRTVRDSVTGEVRKLPARKLPKFIPSKTFEELVR